ncbi:hypothetical protein E3N88_31529 [Mikania micrantha]|uniref:Uncharacterized protein n=1 Tax=Mikania micrantha TaxID=192012 RepID=A0A5N6MPQ1_9ASTR|nr:hypothetical protein E3N88_31529 [Mikania micrantha]
MFDDRQNSKLTSELAKKRIKSDGIPVTKVIKLSTLRKDCKPTLPVITIPCYLYDCFNQRGKHANYWEKSSVWVLSFVNRCFSPPPPPFSQVLTIATALHGVHVVMAVRNIEDGEKVKQIIVNEIPNAKVDVMELDLSSLSSLRKFATKFIYSGLPLIILM